jgi:hypothetical protein
MSPFRLSTIAALLLAITGVAVASASSGGGDRGVEVIHAVRITEQQSTIDLGAAGSSLGDQQVFSARFEVNGERIGFDGGVCTLVRTPAVYQCVATNSLPNGELTAQGLVDFEKAPGPFLFAITGGTQRYRTAQGQVEVLFGQTSDQVTFRIITSSPDHH